MKRKTKNRLLKKNDIRYKLIANHIFDDFYYDGEFESFISNLKKHIGSVKAQLRYWDWYQYNDSWYNMWLRENYSKEYLENMLSEEEHYLTTSYHKDAISGDMESINGQLNYISDRFNCYIRLRFMVELYEIYGK